MNRIDIINAIVKKTNAESYLEVGVQAGHCFNAINCKHKKGVDPDLSSAATHYMTSDDFFENNHETFDVCFSDGLHHADQAERDVLNMLEVLNPGGTIIVHDNLPTTKRMQEIPLQEQVEWTGNVWRTWVKLRATRPDLEMRCINTDWGTSIIRKGAQQIIDIGKPIEEITYEDFEANKQDWMNVITVDQFTQLYL